MHQGSVAVVLGLLGGIAGGFAAGLLLGSPRGGGTSEIVEAGRIDPDLLARIERLETEAGLAAASARLKGRPDPGEAAGPGGLDGAGEEALAARLEERLVERLGPRLDSAVEAKVEELAREGTGGEGGPENQGRPRLSLADVARKIGLSGGEEDDLRRIYAESQEKFLEIMAKPDGDVEQVKRDWETYRDDEASRTRLQAQYVPKLMKNLGDVISLQAEKQSKIREAVGPERAGQLGGYDVVEENPFGMNATVGVSARAESR